MSLFLISCTDGKARHAATQEEAARICKDLYTPVEPGPYRIAWYYEAPPPPPYNPDARDSRGRLFADLPQL